MDLNNTRITLNNKAVTSELMADGNFLVMFYDYDNMSSYGVTTKDETKANEFLTEFATVLN